MTNKRNLGELKKSVGGVSEPSKIPCYSYNTPAKECQTGGKLREVPGSTCSTCYAWKGNYNYPAVQAALYKRMELMANDPNWSANMSELLNRVELSGFFRWFDSGDVQSVEDLVKIVEVCKNTPHLQHWLPTREYGYVSEYVAKYGQFPENLTLRLSAYMTDLPGPTTIAQRLGVLTSAVSTKGNYNCKASHQENQCKDCRLCWNKNVKEIVYKKH